MNNFLRVPFFSSNGAYWRKPHKYSTCILHWKNVRLLKKFMKSKNRCVYYLGVSLIYKYIFCHFLCCRVIVLFEIHYIKIRSSVYHHFWGLCWIKCHIEIFNMKKVICPPMVYIWSTSGGLLNEWTCLLFWLRWFMWLAHLMHCLEVTHTQESSHKGNYLFNHNNERKE